MKKFIDIDSEVGIGILENGRNLIEKYKLELKEKFISFCEKYNIDYSAINIQTEEIDYYNSKYYITYSDLIEKYDFEHLSEWLEIESNIVYDFLYSFLNDFSTSFVFRACTLWDFLTFQERQILLKRLKINKRIDYRNKIPFFYVQTYVYFEEYERWKTLIDEVMFAVQWLFITRMRNDNF